MLEAGKTQYNSKDGRISREFPSTYRFSLFLCWFLNRRNKEDFSIVMFWWLCQQQNLGGSTSWLVGQSRTQLTTFTLNGAALASLLYKPTRSIERIQRYWYTYCPTTNLEVLETE